MRQEVRKGETMFLRDEAGVVTFRCIRGRAEFVVEFGNGLGEVKIVPDKPVRRRQKPGKFHRELRQGRIQPEE